MKIAIISDTHDNLANFLKVINWLNNEKIQLLLHCGDVCNQDTLNESRKSFNGEINPPLLEKKWGVKFVMGDKELHSENFPEIQEIEINNKKIAFTHLPKKGKELAESGKYNLVFYGHTHKPWFTRLSFSKENFGGEEKIGDCRLVNPGEAAGIFYKPTFAVYDTETNNLELKILEKL